jgi:hypothetical protein
LVQDGRKRGGGREWEVTNSIAQRAGYKVTGDDPSEVLGGSLPPYRHGGRWCPVGKNEQEREGERRMIKNIMTVH